jgi:hypothetical protein
LYVVVTGWDKNDVDVGGRVGRQAGQARRAARKGPWGAWLGEGRGRLCEWSHYWLNR